MLAFVACFLLATGAEAAQFQIKNNRGDTIWVGVQGGSGHPALEDGGFILNGHEEKTINAPAHWEGRFWARTGCNPSTQHCDTGDCGNKLKCKGAGGTPPVTLAEIKLLGDANQDYYDLSLVDGFNVLASIGPVNAQRSGCKTLTCSRDINSNCPNDLRHIEHGQTVGCKSSCLRFNQPHYCCTESFNAQTCNPSNWEVNSAGYFKGLCPDAYSYAYDDRSSLTTCKSETYRITFG